MRAVAYWSTHPLVAVGRPDADAVALARRRARAGRGRRVDLLPQLAVGRAIVLVADDERLAVGEASTIRARCAPIVSSTSGRSVGPCVWERSMRSQTTRASAYSRQRTHAWSAMKSHTGGTGSAEPLRDELGRRPGSRSRPTAPDRVDPAVGCAARRRAPQLPPLAVAALDGRLGGRKLRATMLAP